MHKNVDLIGRLFTVFRWNRSDIATANLYHAFRNCWQYLAEAVDMLCVSFCPSLRTRHTGMKVHMGGRGLSR